MTQDTDPVVKRKDIQPVDLKVTVQHGAKAAETCCNYHIAGKSGNMMLVLPPMTHVQDMER